MNVSHLMTFSVTHKLVDTCIHLNKKYVSIWCLLIRSIGRIVLVLNCNEQRKMVVQMVVPSNKKYKTSITH